MTNLPEWMENRRRELYSCFYHACNGCKEREKEAADAFLEALSIAWETLDNYKHLVMVNTSEKGTGSYPIEDAMKRIEAVGK